MPFTAAKVVSLGSEHSRWSATKISLLCVHIHTDTPTHMYSQIPKFNQKDVVSSEGFHPSPGLMSGKAEGSVCQRFSQAQFL